MKTLFPTLAALAVAVACLSPTPADAQGGCWCDPRYPFMVSMCLDNWEVLQGGMLGFTPVCSGAPPPCVHLALAPPECADPWCKFYLTSGGLISPYGNVCISIEDLFPPTFINIWPSIKATKESFARSQAQSIRLIRDLQERLKNLDALGREARAVKRLIDIIATTLIGINAAMRDPVNHDYQHLPTLPILPTVEVFTAGGDLTAAQAAAINAYIAASRPLHAWLQYWSLTVDVLAGALDAPVVEPVWVRRHAAALNGIAKKLGKLGAKELAARAALATAWPTAAIPATCITATQLGTMTPTLVQLGVDLGALALFQADFKSSLCPPASTWPKVFTDALADWQTTYTWIGGLTPAETVCTASGLCSSATALTTTAMPPVLGRVKQTVTVTSTGLYDVRTAVGLVVQVSLAGLPPVPNVTLVAGTATVKVSAPPGVYAMTLTFPEQKAAKFRASTLVTSVRVP